MNQSIQREEYWHWFHGLTGITQREKEELLTRCPDVRMWYEAGCQGKVKELLENQAVRKDGEAFGQKVILAEGYSMEEETKGPEEKSGKWEKIIEALQSQDKRTSAQRSYDKLKKDGIKIVHRDSLDYPESLRSIFLPPFLLYYYGELPKEEEPALAVVGARNCSVYGEEIAGGFCRELSGMGIQIVSGMARGIDAAAQRAAINAGGRAYAVLGSGVDVCYPRENKRLYEELKECGGVISEEVPGTPPASWNFPKRNRIISGLSDAVFVVEARKNSGSLITVSYALEQGKEIYAVPGRIYERLAEGTNLLIQEGAYLVMEPGDILQGFREKYGHFFAPSGEKNKNFEKKPQLLLASREKMVYACLSLRPKHMEQLQEETGFSLPELANLLFDMEMKHYIKQPLKNYYIIQS